MLNKFLLILFCLSVIGCGETIDARQLEIDNGLFYKKGDSDPFNGTAENFYPDYRNKVTFIKKAPIKADKCIAHFKNGMLHGNLECFSSDNERIALIELEEGNKHGREAIWDPSSGNLLYEVEFKKNAKHGHELSYDQSGENLVEEAFFSQGMPVSRKQWNGAGELTLNLTYSKEGLTGFSVNNGGTASYFNAEQGIVIRKHFMFKEGYQKPEWSDVMRYFGNMEGVYVKSVNVESQKGDEKSFDYYDEDGNLLDDITPKYTTKFGLDDDCVILGEFPTHLWISGPPL